jgi:hypothetical protein
MGNRPDGVFDPNYGKIMGAIAALQEIVNKIKINKNGVD